MENQEIKNIKETPIWSLYEKGRNYHRMTGIYTDDKRNYRMYNGNQWDGAKLGGVEPVQKNFIKPIVKYKLAVIHSHLYTIKYSSENFENREFAKQAEHVCDLLNRYASRIWEKDGMDFKLREIIKDAAINDEGIVYIDFDQKKQMPVNEVLKKVDVYYGNENDADIQSQPYILIRRRMSVANAIEWALSKGLSPEKATYIIGDNDNFEQNGEASQVELDNMATIVYKMYKKDGTVHFSAATRLVTILEDKDTGLSLYPIAHFIWESKAGSARGEGEVRNLIANQIEVNKTEMRRVLTVKAQAYPHKVYDADKVANPGALDTVGGIIRTKGQTVDDVRKVVGTIPPAQMSPDVKQLEDDLIQMSRDLAGAGETATGDVNAEEASGRAILAVQQASRAPVTEQKDGTKNLIENIARINLEYLIVYSPDGVKMEEEITDPQTGETYVQMVTVPQVTLQQLQATVRVDVSPRSPFDKFAQEQTMENLLLSGFLTPQRVNELEIYGKLLDDDSVAPKSKIMEVVDYIHEQQRKIAQIDAQAQIMKQRAQQFLMEGPEAQASQMIDAQRQIAPVQGEQMALAE